MNVHPICFVVVVFLFLKFQSGHNILRNYFVFTD